MFLWFSFFFPIIPSFKASVEIAVTLSKVERDLVFNFLDQISSGTFRLETFKLETKSQAGLSGADRT